MIVSTTFVGFRCMILAPPNFQAETAGQAWRSPDWFHINGHQNANSIHGTYWIKIARLGMCGRCLPCQHCFNTQDAVKKKAVDHSSSNHLFKSSIWLYIYMYTYNFLLLFWQKKTLAVNLNHLQIQNHTWRFDFFEFFWKHQKSSFFKNSNDPNSPSPALKHLVFGAVLQRSLCETTKPQKRMMWIYGWRFFSTNLTEGEMAVFVVFLLTNVDIPKVRANQFLSIDVNDWGWFEVLVFICEKNKL